MHIQDNTIVLFLSELSNWQTVCSRNKGPEQRLFSSDKRVMSASLWFVIAVRKCDSIRSSAEKDLAHWALLTTNVKAIWNSFFSVGKANSNDRRWVCTSNTDSSSLPSSIPLARRHSVGSNCESSFNPYKEANDESKEESRKLDDVGLQAFNAFIWLRLLVENRRSNSKEYQPFSL